MFNYKHRQRGYLHPYLDGTVFLDGVGELPRTLVELAMAQLSADLRSGDDWSELYTDPKTRLQWMNEALKRQWVVSVASREVEVQLSRKQVEYVLDELEGYDALRDEIHGCQVSCFDRIWHSDTILDPETLSVLNDDLAKLPDRRSSHKDDLEFCWLIDPYMAPLVYHTTLAYHPITNVLRPEQEPEVVGDDDARDIYCISKHFAFLPTDFSISETGKAEALSCINDLLPSMTTTYTHISAVLSSTVPLFEHVLTDLHRNNPLVQRIKDRPWYSEWDEPSEPEDSDDDEGWAEYDERLKEWIAERPIRIPDVPNRGYRGGLENRQCNINLRGRTVQVITSVTEVRLSPNNPEHPGTPWHVEGMKNESIVACALYYCSMENIADSAIEFRTAVTFPRDLIRGDHGAALRTWGLRNRGPCHQHLGSVRARQGLGVAFPNIYQHRQTRCRLQDPTREGRQIVVSFFLVDPDIGGITSTTMVPLQRKDWLKVLMEEELDERVPVEIIEKIVGEVEGLMSEEEVETWRAEMRRERAQFWSLNDQKYFCVPFDVYNTDLYQP